MQATKNYARSADQREQTRKRQKATYIDTVRTLASVAGLLYNMSVEQHCKGRLAQVERAG
jgi:hypothetical protein